MMRTPFKWIICLIVLVLLVFSILVHFNNNIVSTATGLKNDDSFSSSRKISHNESPAVMKKREKWKNEKLQQLIDTYCQTSLLERATGQEGKLEGQTTGDRYTLVQAHVLLRHGDRTPHSRVRYLPVVGWECGMVDGWLQWRKLRSLRIKPHPIRAIIMNGKMKLFRGYHSQICKNSQLTFKGFSQHRTLGTYFRSRYSNLYSNDKDYKEQLFVQSTDYKRTIHSAGAFLMGFYSKDKSPPHTPIHVSRGTLLEVPPPGIRQHYPYCTQLAKVRQHDLFNNSFFDVQRSTEGIKDRLLKAANVKLPFETTLTEVFDPIWCRICHKKPLPCSSSSPTNEACLNESLLFEGVNSAHFLFSRRYPHDSSLLVTQPFLYHTIIQSMDKAMFSIAAGKEDFTRLTLSFGHDNNILSLASNFGLQIDIEPPYASRIVVELWQDKLKHSPSTSDYFVRVLYNGSPINGHFPMGQVDSIADGQLVGYRSFKRLFTSGRLRELDSFMKACGVEQGGHRTRPSGVPMK